MFNTRFNNLFSTLSIVALLLCPGRVLADTTTYDFATCAAGSTCDSSASHFASGDDVDLFPFAGDATNRNTHLEAIDSEYTSISVSNTTRWTTTDPGAGDEVFFWVEQDLSENPGKIRSIDFTFEGYLNASNANFTIYVKTASGAYQTDASWTQLGATETITTGADTVITRTLSTNIANYLTATGTVVWGIYEDVSSESMLVDYVKMSVNHTRAYTWTGATNTNWANQANWDVGDGSAGNDGYPDDQYDRAIINSTAHNITTAGTLTIGQLQVEGSYSGSLRLTGPYAFTVAGTGITISSGTITGTGIVTSAGNVSGNGTVNMSGGSLIMSGNNKTFGGTSNWTLKNFTLSGSVTAQSTSTITITGSMTGTGNFNAGSKTYKFTASATPYMYTGIFTPQTSIVSFEGTSATTITPLAAYDLQFNPGSGSPTYTLSAQGGSLSTVFDHPTSQYIGTLFFDSANGVMYGSTWGAGGIIYRCATSTGCDTSADWTTAYDTSENALYSFSMDTTNRVMYSGSGESGNIYRCLTSTGCDSGDTDWTTAYETPIDEIRAMVFDASNGVMYAGGWAPGGGAIYRCEVSTGCDSGSSDRATPYTSNTIQAMTMDTTNGVIYAGTFAGGIILRCATSSGCDASGEWTVSYDTSETYIWSMAFDSTNKIMYAGSGTGGVIYRCDTATVGSCDDSSDWTTAYDTNKLYIGSMAFDSANGVLYAGAEPDGVIYKCSISTGCDSGSTDWITGFDTSEEAIVALAIDSTNKVLYAGTYLSALILRRNLNGFYIGNDFTLTGAGNVTANINTSDPNIDINGDLTINSGDVVSASNNAILSIAGNWTNDGTFTHNSGTVTFDGGGTSTLNGNTTFYKLLSPGATDLDFSGSDTYTFSTGGVFTAEDNVTVSAGSTVTGTTTATTWGDLGGTGSINMTGGSWALTGTARNFGSTANWTFKNLLFSNSATAQSTSDITVSGSLIVHGSFSAGSKTYKLTGSSLPYVQTGTFTPQTSLVSFEGTSATTVDLTTAYNLQFNPASGSPTYTLRGPGASFTTSYNTPEIYMYSMGFDSTNGVMYAGSSTTGYIYRCATSTGCDSASDWITAYDPSETTMYSFGFDSTNAVMYAGGGEDGVIYRCLTSSGCDSGDTDWTTAYNSVNTEIKAFVFDAANGIMYAGSYNPGVIFRCDITTGCDSADTDWITSLTTGINSLTIDTTNGVIYAGHIGGGIIYRCPTSSGCDLVGEWTAVLDTDETTIDSLAFDSTNGVLYAGSEPNGIIYRCATSTGCDSGFTDWTTAYNSNETYIWSLAFDSFHGVVYAGTNPSGIIYRCSVSSGCDSSADWMTEIVTGEVAIFSLGIDTTHRVLYAGTVFDAIILRKSLDSTFSIGNDLSLTGAGNGTVNANTHDPVVNVDGDISIGSGDAFQASNTGTLYIGDDWTNSGSFTHNNGTVTFDGATTHALTGATTFSGLKNVTAGSDMIFQHSTTFTIAGSLKLTGSAGNEIVLDSSDSTTRFTFSVSATQNVQNLDVSNSQVSGTKNIIAVNSLDNGNTDSGEASPHWVFSNTYNTYIWSGAADATTWELDGNWTGPAGYPTSAFDRAIINSTSHDIDTDVALTIGELRMSTGFTGSVNLDGAMTVEGTGVLITAGTLTASGTLDINGTLTLSGTLDLTTHNAGLEVDGNVTVNTNGKVRKASTRIVKFNGNLTYRDNVGGTNFGDIVVDPTTTLGTDFTADSVHILSGDTLDADGYEMNISGTLEVDGTLDASTGTDDYSYITVGGKIDMTGGLFINTGSEVILNGAGGQIISNGESFNRLTIFTGDWSFSDTATVNDDLVNVHGTVTLPTSLTVAGDLRNQANINHNSGTVTLTSSGSMTVIEGNTDQFYNLIFNNASGTWSVEGTLTVANDVTMTAGELVGSANLIIAGDVTGNGSIIMSGSSAYLYGLKSISTDFFHTCAVSNSGRVYCWGYATDGALGNGTTTPDQASPIRGVLKGAATGVDSDGTYLINIKAVAAGGSHTCALSYTGRVYCWGVDAGGELGNGAGGNTTVPALVEDGEATGADSDGTYLRNIRMISTADNTSCAVSHAGKAYCWGSDFFGQNGNGAAGGASQHDPVRVHDGEAVGSTDSDGTYLINVRSIDAANHHICATTNSGNAYCWGEAVNGRLGNGSTSPDKDAPVRVQDGAAAAVDSDGTYLTNIKSIAASSTATCAVSFAGNGYCWGDDDTGKIGNGAGISGDQSTPTRLEDGDATGADSDGTYLININVLDQSYGHGCAVTYTGKTYCWGWNGDGGTGTGTDEEAAALVQDGAATGVDSDGTNLINIKSIELGNTHSCALANSGNMYCWGRDNEEELGNGPSTADQNFPNIVLKGAMPEDPSLTLTGVGNFGGNTAWQFYEGEFDGDTTGTGSGGITFASSTTVNSAGEYAANDPLDINGTFTVEGMFDLNTNDSDVNISGTIFVNSAGEVEAGIGVVTLDGSLAYHDNVGGTNFGRVTVTATTTLATDFTADSLRITSGDRFEADGYETTLTGTMDIEGTFDGSPGSDDNVIIKVGGVWDMTGGTFTNTNSEVILDGDGSITSNGDTFNRLTILNGDWSFTDTATVNDDLVNVHGTVTLPSALTVAGDLRNQANIIHNSGTITLTSSGSQTIIEGNADAFYNMIFNNASGTWSVTGTLNLANDLTMTAGSLIGSANLTIAGDVTGNGSIVMTGSSTYLYGLKEIDTRFFTSCGLTNTGRVYCWGESDGGRLGNGTTTPDQSVPSQVVKGAATGADTDGTYLINIKSISVGGASGCALSHSGHVYCWGDDGGGALGNGAGGSTSSPALVEDGVATGADTDGTYLTNIRMISAGHDHSCAVSNPGYVYCWGWDGEGELGDGAPSGTHATPVLVLKGEAVASDNDGTYLTNVKSMEISTSHACALTYSGMTYCWGLPTDGRLGNGSTSPDQETPVLVQDGEAAAVDSDGTNLINIVSISLGNDHTCALSASGNAYCWGDDGAGKLGNGATSGDQSTPVRVEDGVATGSDTDGTYLINLKALEASYGTTCALAYSGKTYCWGFDGGALGNAPVSGDQDAPILVVDGAATGLDSNGTNLTNIKALEGGNGYFCALSNSGKAYCWGRGAEGQLGNGALTEQDEPNLVLKGAVTENQSLTLTGVGNFGGNTAWSFYDGVFDGSTTRAGNGGVTLHTAHVLTNNTLLMNGYEMVITGTMNIDGTLVATSGSGGKTTITVGGTWDMTGGTFTSTNSTVMLNGTMTAAIYSDSESFYNLLINDGLIAYWKFNETGANSCTGGTNDSCDSSGHAYDGAWGNNATAGTNLPIVNFASTRSVALDGTDDYVQVSGLLGQPVDITIAAWFKLTAADGNGSEVISLGDAVGIRLDQGGIGINGFYYTGTVWQDTNILRFYAGTGWHHVSYVMDDSGNFQRLYVDGNLVDSSSYTESINYSGVGTNTFIGKHGDGDTTRDFNGFIDDVRVYDRALSAAEVLRLAQGNQPSTGLATITLEDTLDVNGTLVLATGKLDTKSGENNTINIAGSWWNYGGDVIARSGIVNFDGTSSPDIIQSNGIIESFNTVNITGAGGWTLNDNITTTGTINLDAGTLTHTTSVTGITITGSLELGGGTFTGTGTGVLIDGNLSLLSGTFNAPNYLVVSGNWLRSSGTFNDNSGTVVFSTADSENITSGSESFDNVLIGDGLIGYWKLDETAFNGCTGGTDVCDSSGNGYHGTETGTPTISGTGAIVNFANAGMLDFDGTTDRVNFGDVAEFDLNDNADATISGWFYRDTFSTDHTIIAKRNGQTAGDIGWVIYIDDTSDQVIFEISDGTDEYQMASTATFTATGWIHFAVVWDQDSAANSRIHINGVDAETHTGTIGNIGNASNGDSLQMAAESDNGTPFDGKLDDVRIYNRTLSTKEIAVLARSKVIGHSTNADEDTLILEDALDVNGTLLLASATLDTKASEDNGITLAGNWLDVGGTFTANQGTVTLDTGATHTISGTTTFYNLKNITASSGMTFGAGQTFSVDGTLRLNGQAVGTRISLNSSNGSTRFTFDVNSTQNVSYVNVSNSNASGFDINASFSLDTVNNDSGEGSPQWVFVGGGPLRGAVMHVD